MDREQENPEFRRGYLPAKFEFEAKPVAQRLTYLIQSRNPQFISSYHTHRTHQLNGQLCQA